MATYTVVKGDCLWSIAERFLGSGLKWTYLADLNGIPKDNPIIYVDQVIKLDANGGQEPPPSPPLTETTNTIPIIQYFGLQAGTDTTVFAAWVWSKENTDSYQMKWDYDTGNGLWFTGNDSTTTEKQSVYSAPQNAIRVRCKVKPISQKRKVNDQDVAYWTAGWSTEKIYNFKDNPPSVPSAPSVEIEQFTLTASLDNVDINAKQVQFQVVKDNTIVFNTGNATINTTSVSYSCKVDAGSEYKVRCRGVRDNIYGDWSTYSGSVGTIPSSPSKIITCRANSETSVYLEWNAVPNVKSYEIEYTTKKEYFDGSDKTTTVAGVEYNHYEKTGLESGQEYFFRVRATNDKGSSSWSEIRSVVIGEKPAAPTTWSSTTTAIIGEVLTLYWVHNSADGSRQTYAEVEITIGGKTNTYTIRGDEENETEEEHTYSYKVETSGYTEGTKILWRVRTAGVTKQYGDWSIQRTADIYTPPTLSLSVLDGAGETFDELTAFPFRVSALAGPNTQVPVGYHLVIVSNEIYETVDSVGTIKIVNKGEQVYAQYFDGPNALSVELSAYNIDLENNITYTLTCSVSMDSGLTAEENFSFTVHWVDAQWEPNAEIVYDKERFVTYIRPYCEDGDNQLVSDVFLSVYRREFDGTFTEIATKIDNKKLTFVTDPHPSLDFARYRIVAVTKETGGVSYSDLPGYPVGEQAVIIQWNDYWSNFDTTNEDAIVQPPWSGSLLRLPYDIDVSDKNDMDVALIEYSGRKRPVSYYGTQLGSTATWSVKIPKEDKETLYSIRRLSIWPGDVYVREPSGSGYWANISVSFNQTHKELTIPITFEITRVEGGM